ncbi:Guanosine-diphosphatase [Dispira simplex]|nr:Guanosine-diphosphatase [Dispira simplex]
MSVPLRETFHVQDADSDTISVADSEGNYKYGSKPRQPWSLGRQAFRYLLYGGLALFILWMVFSLTGWNHSPRSIMRLLRPGDPALTSQHCDVAHPGKPLVQYALMIDAGSTGSRIHVYRFNYCKERSELESEIFDHTQPGLSYYANDPKGAAESLDSLMLTAQRSVPLKLHHCTPIAVKATAGLRLQGEKESQAILQAVREHLESKYNFPIIKKEGVAIMDGTDEGVYAWVTVNYLLDLVGNKQKDPTAAVLDLGGGSTQIVFEPTTILPAQKFTMVPGEHHYKLDYDGHHYDLYQHSYLGYGLKEARRQIKEAILDDYLREHPQSNGQDKTLLVPNPCFPANHTEEWQPTNHQDMSPIMFQGVDSGSWKSCYNFASRILYKHAPCSTPPCSFQGVYQPPLAQYFQTNPIYIFSFFFDRTNPLGMRDTFKLKEMRTLTKRACMYQHEANTRLPVAQQVLTPFDAEALAELHSRPHYCMDLNFMYSLLNTGYDIPETREIHMAKQIKGYETGWCLGATIAMLNEGELCKLEEVTV